MKIIESVEQKARIISIITKDLKESGLLTTKKREVKRPKSKEDILVSFLTFLNFSNHSLSLVAIKFDYIDVIEVETFK